ncbi:MAG: amidohydrolase family protein [Bacteroidota bacterium]|nr:amidohydrolase family protein [Bacteroidota bacterium]
MNFKIGFFVSIFLGINFILFAQNTFPTYGTHDKRAEIHAFINANIFTDYQTLIINGTLLIEKNKIIAVGNNISIPKNAIVHNLKKKYIFPSFIELHSNYGIEANARNDFAPGKYTTEKQGAYDWNEAIKSYQLAAQLYKNNPSDADALRKAGFGVVLTHQTDGIVRGTSALVALSDKKENENLLVEKVGSHFSFNRGTSTQEYPRSLMGCIALLRQTLYDAQWYAQSGNKKEKNIALAEINAQNNLPKFFDADNFDNLLRANKVAEEFGYKFVYKGSGSEYQQLDLIKNIKGSFVIPVAYPLPYDVEDPLDAEIVSYKMLKEWEMAPFNLAHLNQAGISFAVTSHGLKEKTMLIPAMQKAIQLGLPYRDALKALTFTPALLTKQEQIIGSLKPSMYANFIIASDSLFKEGTIIHENWVLGDQYVLKPIISNDIRGIYSFTSNISSVSGIDTVTLSITGKSESPELEIIKDTIKVKGTIQFQESMSLFSFEWKKNKYKLTAWKNGANLEGIGEVNNTTRFNWKANLDLNFNEPTLSDSIKKVNAKNKFKEDSTAKSFGKLKYPINPNGYLIKPKAQKVLFKNATIWTSEKDGILKNSDLLIEGGKIIAIGKLGDVVADTTIDATGLHITPGFIDEHSHIAIAGGVNECTHSITAEVRIGDIINPTDINIFRNLAGGVTAAQLLHGSCNAIGGQSALIKLRWGQSAEEMKIKNADGFIKFALGENVKQSNWGDNYTSRFPQTRMGVEQIYTDAFNRALDYEKEWKTFNSSSSKDKVAPRKDLQLEAILEILNKKRFITCHSYVQSEILMLMDVCEKYNFKVNTFTHILEGYKVAARMKQHGAGASTFADWWAYKMEVKDAIPYNAALMYEAGVVTAINSDDAEMARRLNHEAAKAIKYGKVPEEEALKMITINPAKLLHLDKQTGSIKVGKDADIVLWTTYPLSIEAKVMQTYVDGINYYDYNRLATEKKNMDAEKIRIKNRMLEAKKKGSPTLMPQAGIQKLWHCEDAGVE